MSLSSFFSSLLPSAECEAPPPEEKEEKPEEEGEGEEASAEKEDASEGGDGEEASEEEEEEEEEPEDPMTALREECQEASCRKYAQHFAHCQEKVEGGEGFKGEDCVEEMFHMMHCVDNCVAPKLFAKLR